MARPTNSLALLYQIFGRGVQSRVLNLKECLIIDFCNNPSVLVDRRPSESSARRSCGWGVFNNTHLLMTPMGAEMTIEQLDGGYRVGKKRI